MTTNRRGRGPRGGRGRPPAAVRPREGDETSQTRATKELLPRPGTSSPSGGAEHDLFHACTTGLRPSRPGTEPVPCQDHVALPPSARPAVSYLEKLLCNITLKETSISSPILVRKPPDWYFTFYIRTDLQGYFHTYPTLGKPFKTLQEADNAINRHLHDLQDPKMSDDSLGKLSLMERAVQESIYWPDGTRRNCLEPPDKNKDEIHLLVQALVDQYNEDHNLLGDCALQLKDVPLHQFFFSKGNEYYHFNFIARTEGVVDSFFAEVQCTRGEHEEMVLSCISIVEPDDDGHCYGCRNNGAVDMKHPNKADAYCHGRVDEYLPLLGGYDMDQSYLAESVEDEERRLRSQYECFDDPSFMAEYFPNCV